MSDPLFNVGDRVLVTPRSRRPRLVNRRRPGQVVSLLLVGSNTSTWGYMIRFKDSRDEGIYEEGELMPDPKFQPATAVDGGGGSG